MVKQFYSIICISFILIQCNSNQKSYLLKKKSATSTNIVFKNQLKDDAKNNIVNYLYYYNGGGVAVGDINNDNLPDLFFVSNENENKLYLNLGNLKFKDISKSAGINGSSDWNTGVTMVDINNDGFLDIYVSAVVGMLDFKGHNELFINNGDNTFTEKSKEFGLDYKGYTTQAYFFDYDKDDDLDVYLVNHAVHTKTSHGPAMIRKKRDALVGDVLLQNNNQKFTNVSEQAQIYGGVNGYGLSASIADFNNDGWEDIYVCNDFHEDDYYYINNKNGTFSEKLASNFSYTSRFSMGSDACDINRDGFTDLITLDMLPMNEKHLKESDSDVSYSIQDYLLSQGYQHQYARNMLQINNNGKYFTETALYNNIAATDWSWSPLIADFNQDGFQDIFVSNGISKRPNNLDFMKYIASSFKNKKQNQTKDQWLVNSLKEMPDGKIANQIFEGNTIKFKNQTGNWIDNSPSISNGTVYADLDLDGDLDIITNNMDEFASIYENMTNDSKNYLNLKLIYKGQNKNAIGSKIILYQGLNKQTKHIQKSRGFISAIESKIYFGIDTLKTIDSLLVVWPNNSYQKIINPKINQTLKVNYIENKLTYNQHQKAKTPFFNKENNINYIHKEDQYNDFNNEKLIPYKISTEGPAIAIGDINNDGFSDLFIGNSSGKKAKLFTSNGLKLTEFSIPEIEKDSLSEDISAVFFDADNDNDLDLYIVSGINTNRKNEYENDRLYLNNGTGKFSKSTNIPENLLNGSCVVAYDYNNDGAIDLFIGNRSNPNKFGSNVASYLLKNNGKGHFVRDNNFSLSSKVTSAVWEDLNNDGLKDLIVACEWDNPKVYLNKNGKLILQTIKSDLNGLWQSVSTYDIDADGDKDIILGNWGLNTKFKATPKHPLLMYYDDFDTNGKSETILAYYKNGNYYPVNSKDELASQMNYLSKKFTNYKDFANQPIENVIGKEKLMHAKLFKVATLESGYLINNNGKFEQFVKLPKPFQLSPIKAFLHYNSNNENNLIVAGNFHGLNTYHGIFSSNNGLIISENSKKLKFTNASEKGLQFFNKEIRKMELLKLKNKTLLIAVENNDSISIYSYK